MADHEIKVHELKEIVRVFCEERDWEQFHNAKDLAIAISIEASELLELFRFKNPDEVKALLEDEKGREKVRDELADVLQTLMRFAQLYDIDLSEALERKMVKNVEKYPIEKSRGTARKYNELE